jgi:capsular exopolysaccharide synthesis family protein
LSRAKRIDVPSSALSRNRIISQSSPGVELDSYRLMRTRVLRRMEQNGWLTLGITSSVSGEGKTLTAVNLAASIAMERDHMVLLVDADLRRPAVHKVFEIDSAPGLEEYLSRDVDLAELLVNPGLDGFYFLPCSAPIRGSSEVLRSARMARCVDELKTRFASRLVIFNLPPVLVGDDVVAFTTLVDAVLLVIEDGKTAIADLKKSVHLLEEVEVLGTVLNKSTEPGFGYTYEY